MTLNQIHLVPAPSGAKNLFSALARSLAICLAVGTPISTSTHDVGAPYGPSEPHFNFNSIFIDDTPFPASQILDSASFGKSPIQVQNQSQHAGRRYFGAPDDKKFRFLKSFHFSHRYSAISASFMKGSCSIWPTIEIESRQSACAVGTPDDPIFRISLHIPQFVTGAPIPGTTTRASEFFVESDNKAFAGIVFRGSANLPGPPRQHYVPLFSFHHRLL